jgi:hypothetical protein
MAKQQKVSVTKNDIKEIVYKVLHPDAWAYFEESLDYLFKQKSKPLKTKKKL